MDPPPLGVRAQPKLTIGRLLVFSLTVERAPAALLARISPLPRPQLVVVVIVVAAVATALVIARVTFPHRAFGAVPTLVAALIVALNHALG
eukprot:2105809-Prymnesium_polylepis.1